MIEHVIVHSDNVMQSNHMLFRQPHGPASEWAFNLGDVLHDGPFVPCCEEWQVMTAFFMLKPLTGEYS